MTAFEFRLHPVPHVFAGPDVLAARRHARGDALVPRVPARAAARGERLLRVADRAAGAAVPGGAPHAEGLRRRVDGARHAEEVDAAPRAGAHGRHAAAARRRPDAVADPAGPVRRRSTRRGSSGTGGPTSCASSPTRRSPSTAGSRSSCRRRPRRCTCTPSTAPSTTSHPATARSAYRDANWAEVIVGVDPDPAGAAAISEVDGRLLGRHPPVLRRRRLRELHDGRGAGARAGHVRRQLRAGWRASRPSTTRPTCSA